MRLIVLSWPDEYDIEQKIVSAIENVHKFHVFYNSLVLHSLWNDIFFELVDNEPFSCSEVVCRTREDRE